MINVVTAPEHRYFPDGSKKIFLAGGICNCAKWQQDVIESLNKKDRIWGNCYILNPRREDWIEEPDAAVRQIEWEFDMIERCDYFTMYFAGGESDQPICMYELGRNIERMKQKFPNSWENRIIITCDSNYKRFKDVLVQTRLASDDRICVNYADGYEKSIEKHISEIQSIIK